MYRALGQWCYRHWKLVIPLWLLALVGATGASGAVGAAFDSSFSIPASESRSGFETLDQYFSGQGNGFPAQIVVRADEGVNDPEVKAAMTEVFDYTASLDPALQVQSPYEPGPRPQIAVAGPEAGRIGYASITVGREVDQVKAAELGQKITSKIDEVLSRDNLTGKVQVEVGGSVLAAFKPPETEAIGLAFAVVVLILAFGSVMAMGLPIGVAVAGVGTGIGLISLLSNAISMPTFSTQVGAMIGLGVGIDYALFIVTRYRASLHAGHSHQTSIGIAMDTAGRAVVFAGLTVVVSLLGMLLIGLKFISGLGIGAAVTVAITMISSVTLLPALLGAVGHRVEVSRFRGMIAAGLVALGLFSFGIKAPIGAAIGFGLAALVLIVGQFLPVLKRVVPHRPPKPVRETVPYRWSRMIQGHPWLALIVGTVVLLGLASPVLSLHMGFSDDGNFPPDTTTRRAYDLIADGFGPGYNSPLLIAAVLDSPAALAQAQELAQAVAATPGVASASPAIPNTPNDPGSAKAALIQVIATTSPQDRATEALVKTLRTTVVPAHDEGLTVAVTGATPANMDFTSYLGARILLFFGVVLALSFLLLMAVFRSVVVPLKAVIMNVLSIAASYGMVVAIFQWGWLGQISGVAAAPIEPFIPMMLFAIVFGLSMDYEVFLLSRVKEEYERTGDPQNSVADGLAGTARVISAAAAIMIVVFGSFMFEENRIIKLFGLGLSLAVLLDASFVRLLLVPATMELLGARNWWLPRWLDRIIPNLNVEGTHVPDPVPAMAGATAGNGSSNGNGSGPSSSAQADDPEPDSEPVAG